MCLDGRRDAMNVEHLLGLLLAELERLAITQASLRAKFPESQVVLAGVDSMGAAIVHLQTLVRELSEIQSNELLLTNIMQHLLQIAAWPEALAVSHWQHEVDGWRVQVGGRLRRSPKLRADVEAGLAQRYRDAVRTMHREVGGVPRLPVPDDCPFTLEELLADAP
jgi:hypothetical protein